MERYCRLNVFEREEVALGLAQGLSQREIAALLGRSPSTICREISRSTCYGEPYRAVPARSIPKRTKFSRGCLKNYIKKVNRLRQKYAGKRLKILFEDEAVFGLFTDVYKVWCKVGQRPMVKKQQSRQHINVFGAVCPATGQTQAISSPAVNTEAMNVFLGVISEANAGYEVVIFMDRTGWHTANALDVPENVNVKYLPAYSPQLNPAEHLWEYLRIYWTGNRYYSILDDLIQTIGDGFEHLFKNASIIKSLCNFSWIKDAELL